MRAPALVLCVDGRGSTDRTRNVAARIISDVIYDAAAAFVISSTSPGQEAHQSSASPQSRHLGNQKDICNQLPQQRNTVQFLVTL